MSEKRSQVVEKDVLSSGYLKRVVDLEKDFANASADAECLNTHHTVDKNLLDAVCTVLALHKTA